jgi:hypothetical protein
MATENKLAENMVCFYYYWYSKQAVSMNRFDLCYVVRLKMLVVYHCPEN